MASSKHTRPASPRELAELEREADLPGEEVNGTDSGPHAEISRESPSGQPGDTTKPRTKSTPGAP